ncbi:hypothetical protein ZOSMA_182G00380 [Zostera marina]|uniref:Uncharacterized protein n=1 Tax=Zostera marina TaxID=29655 RepID=A0A0K9PSX7_ZOSMR|nr:hypothetical protein ZOSMA_182G00380 [Zostera marina]
MVPDIISHRPNCHVHLPLFDPPPVAVLSIPESRTTISGTASSGLDRESRHHDFRNGEFRTREFWNREFRNSMPI